MTAPHSAFDTCSRSGRSESSNARGRWWRSALVAMVAVLAIGCGDSSKPAFDEDAVVAYLNGLNVTGTTNQLDPALVEDARNICTRPLDDGTIAVIKVSVGQGTDKILRAGCPDRVAEVMSKG